jgi:hypothetical protein
MPPICVVPDVVPCCGMPPICVVPDVVPCCGIPAICVVPARQTKEFIVLK